MVTFVQRELARLGFVLIFLGTTPTIARVAEVGTHDTPNASSRSSTREDTGKAEWKKRVEAFSNEQVLKGMDSDTFLEREASSAEAVRRLVDDKLPLEDLIAVRGNKEASPELRRRIDQVLRKAITDEKVLKKLMQLAEAKATPAPQKQQAEKILEDIPRIGWAELVTKLRDATRRKMPPKGTAGEILEKLLAAIPEADRKTMKTDIETFSDPEEEADERKLGAARTKNAFLSAAKKLGLVATERPLTGLFEMTRIELSNPKDKTGRTYVLEVVPIKGVKSAISLQTVVSINSNDIVSGITKLPNGAWGLKGLPKTTEIETDQVAVATPGETKRLSESEGHQLSKFRPGELQWLLKNFPELELEIFDAFGNDSL